MALTNQQKIHIDRAWAKLLSLVGYPNGIEGVALSGIQTWNEVLAVTPVETTQDMTLWVDTNIGNDSSGNGTSGLPFKTISRALSAVPLVVRHIVTIKLKPGTYAETIRDGRIYTLKQGLTGELLIEGTDWTRATLASGAEVGTLGAAAADGITRTVTGANWTPGNLVGKFVKLTSGPEINNAYPIAGNTSDTIELPTASSTLTNHTFEIVEPAAVITRGTSEVASAMIVNTVPTLSSNGLKFRRLKFASGSFYDVYQGQGGSSFAECHFSSASVACVYTSTLTNSIGVSRSFMQIQDRGVGGNGTTSFLVGGSVFNGGSYGYRFGDMVVRWGPATGGHTIFQGQTQASIWMESGFMIYDNLVSTTKLIVRNGTGTGMRITGGGQGRFGSLLISGMGSSGIHLMGNDAANGGSRLEFSNATIQNCGDSGVRIDSAHNGLYFGSGTVITSNAARGIYISENSSRSAFNNVWIQNGVNISGNTLGDVVIASIANTWTFTVADIKARPNQLYTDTVAFNRVAVY